MVTDTVFYKTDTVWWKLGVIRGRSRAGFDEGDTGLQEDHSMSNKRDC